MTGLKAQLNRKLHECGRDPLSLFLLGCVIAAALITFLSLIHISEPTRPY